MSPTTIMLVVYCVLILLASLAGGWIPIWVKLTHKRMELAVSFVAGVMLGVGLLLMLPHALEMQMDAWRGGAGAGGHAEGASAHGLVNPVVLWLLAGFLVMFFIERFFCFHHHDATALEPSAANDSDHPHGHEHDHADPAHHHAQSKHHLTWTGAAIGLSIHSLIDGMALAASVEVARHVSASEPPTVLAGLGTFLVIFLHKPFDSLTLGTLMGLGRWTPRARHLVNILFSLLIPLGVGLFYLGVGGLADGQNIVSYALAFAAGTFLCIAMSDLLPELRFHRHDRIKLSAALLMGLAVAWLVGVLETQMG